MLLHATLSSWSVGWSYFTKTTCAFLFIWEHDGASLRLVHPRTWFKPPVANCFATDRSNAVTPRVLTFVNCLWRLFWNWLLYNHAVFSSLLFGCVGRLCLLDVAIPDMHISLFYIFYIKIPWKTRTSKTRNLEDRCRSLEAYFFFVSIGKLE